ncbi:MAG: hypothetical protein A2285_07380 [Elusimicrobia bacterium RIFOXYA12_FULL_57_11]|nr:MAG: hypothetical protein A2285_07380 [Elusimicrobia bacterium RIFOXYA12_FULL_57_11]
MNQNKVGTFIPVIIKTSLDLPPLWGRLSRLSPLEAELASQFELQAGRVVTLSFELRGAFDDIRARITAVSKDGDGYFNYSLVFLDHSQTAVLAEAITAQS